MNDIPVVDDKLSGLAVDNYLDTANDGVMTFQGKKYAVGLIWLASSDIEAQDTLYKKAKAIHADYYCTRTFVQQNGFGRLKKGHRLGMPSMAAAAADALVGEWHGVFKGDDAWLYIAVHSDNIAPDGDRLFQIEEEAYNYFVEQSKKYKWPKTYVPENWNIKNNDGEISIEQLIEDTQLVQLKPVNLNAVFGGAANKSVALMVFLGIAVLIFLAFVSQNLLTSMLPERAAEPTDNIVMGQSLAVPPPREEIKANPIETLIETTQLPQPSKIVGICVENFDDLMVSIPGWDIERMRCRGNFVEAVWRRGVGNLETLQSSLNELPFGVSKTYGSSGDFLASRVINIPQDFQSQIQLTQREPALLLLNNRLSGLGALQVRDIVPQVNNQRNNRNARQAEEQEITLTLQDIPSLNALLRTDMSPSVIKRIVNIPGLKFNMIEWDIGSGTWSYDMQVYLFPENYTPNNR